MNLVISVEKIKEHPSNIRASFFQREDSPYWLTLAAMLGLDSLWQGDQMWAFAPMSGVLEGSLAQKKRGGRGHFCGHFSKTVATPTKICKNRSKIWFLGQI